MARELSTQPESAATAPHLLTAVSEMFMSHLYRHFSLICWAPAIPQALYVSGHSLILKALCVVCTLLLLVGSALVLAPSSSVRKKSVASSCLPPCFCSFSSFCYIASDFLTRLGAPGDREHTYLSSYLTCQCLYPESDQCLWNQVNLTSPFLIVCLELY